MPELPEVETMVRGIRERMEGHLLTDALACRCLFRPILISPKIVVLRAKTRGETVRSVQHRAKRIVITLGNGSAFVVEPRMTGLMLLGDPPDREHLRFEWQLRRGRRRHSVWFWDRRGLGTVRLLTPDQLESFLGPENLGPEPLSLTPELWRNLLGRTDRPIKIALLDQKLVAGIGNLYASEILHLAGISPGTVSSRLSLRRVSKLHAATIEVLEQAIRHEGSTLGDGTYRNALNQNGGYQNQHRVYDKANEICTTCRRGTIKRIVQAQRSTFFCPRCQK